MPVIITGKRTVTYIDYSEWPQVMDTAKLGTKLPASDAMFFFPDLADRFQHYGY
jgi:hypothetical protein